MSQAKEALYAYIATLGAITLLTLAAAAVVLSVDTDKNLPEIVASLGFIGAAVTGLIGVIGTFRPKSYPTGGQGDPLHTTEEPSPSPDVEK